MEPRITALLERWQQLKQEDAAAEGNPTKYTKVWSEQIALLEELHSLKCERLPGETQSVIALWAATGKRLAATHQMMSRYQQ